VESHELPPAKQADTKQLPAPPTLTSAKEKGAPII
jgi:hypothetical protein